LHIPFTAIGKRKGGRKNEATQKADTGAKRMLIGASP